MSTASTAGQSYASLRPLVRSLLEATGVPEQSLPYYTHLHPPRPAGLPATPAPTDPQARAAVTGLQVSTGERASPVIAAMFGCAIAKACQRTVHAGQSRPALHALPALTL